MESLMSRHHKRSELTPKKASAADYDLDLDAKLGGPFRSASIRRQTTIEKRSASACTKASNSDRQIQTIKITEIELTEAWSRRGGAEIELLTSSFQTVGQRVPISVSKGPNGLYRIVDGLDRYEA